MPISNIVRTGCALQEAGYMEDEVNGLTEIFAPVPESTRRVCWQTVDQRGE